MNAQRRRCSGNAMIEFTLVGIPILFVLISIWEMSRGMWMYETLAHSVREGVRFASVHGQSCSTTPHSCAVTAADVARRIRYHGIGLAPEEYQLTFVSQASSETHTLAVWLTREETWPPAAANSPGLNIHIVGVHPFRSALSMFWPGAGPGMNYPAFQLSATGVERIHF